MPDYDSTEDYEHLPEGPSKSELKRRMTALQALGETLTGLSDKQLRQIPIDDQRLVDAIQEVRNISSNSARRRHLQFIGKLMRDIDAEPIAEALAALDRERHQAAAQFQGLEQVRDRLLAAGLPGIEDIIDRWPNADRQHLRQLLLQDQRERQREKAPAAARKLFRYLRELEESAAEPDGGSAPED
ncbi:ribosome biogenesis factor YjgA [Haliea sp. E1-2-M8]|uniref:ribosome biogenesis factor YjgA n=1 Tax=Haliea sp. E1-2-M8 TaxID=3064706 RepID=UPI002722B17D|nr:ribosome biogenesis factor YjgA [Haliea sp. E1-2-M8]MDO8861354.1 ribosome biogenesis factor YjgA [Haliea sp. E1-2-M8]